MSLQKVIYSWLAGWRYLLLHTEAYGSEYFPLMTRLRIELNVLCRMPADAGFRRAVLLLTAAQLLVLSLTWHLDLTGWRRDLLRMMPGMLSLPWLAHARHDAIRASLEKEHRPNRD